jgi:hypothetical protein
VLVAVLDPDPINYFYHWFGYYNWVKLPVSITGREYFEILDSGPEDSLADAMLINSETVIWMPMSKKWAIWGERSYGVCILAFADDKTKIALESIIKTWKPVDIALKDFVDINFKDYKAPKEFADPLLKNYSNFEKSSE